MENTTTRIVVCKNTISLNMLKAFKSKFEIIVSLSNWNLFLQNTTTTIFDTEPAQWVNIGVEILSDGTNVTKTFDELWDMYQHPDYGDVITQRDIIEVMIIHGRNHLSIKFKCWLTVSF